MKDKLYHCDKCGNELEYYDFMDDYYCSVCDKKHIAELGDAMEASELAEQDASYWEEFHRNEDYKS